MAMGFCVVFNLALGSEAFGKNSLPEFFFHLRHCTKLFMSLVIFPNFVFEVYLPT